MKRIAIMMSLAAMMAMPAVRMSAEPAAKEAIAYDTRESSAGTGDLFYYAPKDNNFNAAGEDLNAISSFRFLSLTSRFGLDVTGYQFGRTKFGAKIETDFYSGLSAASSTKINGAAQLRLRQAYVTLGWDDMKMKNGTPIAVAMKIGQAWHPMAADQPHVFSLETGAPFNAFSRTPQVLADASFGKNVMLSAAALWQMQYQSQGPDKATSDYIKYSCVPEFYLGLTLKSNNGFLARIGTNLLSIKPRRYGTIQYEGKDMQVKVSDRITTMSPYVYLQYKSKMFEVKAKTIFSHGGEHMNLMSGYGIELRQEVAGHPHGRLYQEPRYCRRTRQSVRLLLQRQCSEVHEPDVEGNPCRMLQCRQVHPWPRVQLHCRPVRQRQDIHHPRPVHGRTSYRGEPQSTDDGQILILADGYRIAEKGSQNSSGLS